MEVVAVPVTWGLTEWGEVVGSGCRLPQHRIWLGWYELVA